MFASTELAARIERAEARLSKGVAEVVHARRPDLRTIVMPISGGFAVYAGPSSPVNKLIGLGFDGPLDLEVLEQVEREWAARDETVRIELSILADASIPVALSARGYHVHGYENVLGRALDDEPGPGEVAGLTIERLREEDERAWIDVAVTAFTNLDGTGSTADDAIPRALMEEVLTDFAGAAGFLRYLARIDGRPVGTGTMRLDGDLAQIAGSGTLPDARGRGVQKALIQQRMADARAAGADLAVVTTSPGTRSQQNVMRRGFILLYTRIIFVKHSHS